MESLFLLAFAIAPPIMVVYFIKKADYHEEEPIEKLIKAFLFGVLSTLPSYIVLTYITMPLFTNAFTEAFIGVGLVEEFFKFSFLWYFFYRDKEFNEPLDGIVYALTISMGFAAAENFVYVFDWYAEYGFEIAFGRMFTAIPAHATFGVVMGYIVGHGKFLRKKNNLKIFGFEIKSKKENDFLLLGLFSAAIFHGIYDYFLFLDIPNIQIFSFIFLGIAINFSFKAIQIHQENSPFNRGKEKEINTQNLKKNPLVNYFINILKFKYADFNGRARRSEFWYFNLFSLIISGITSLLDLLLFQSYSGLTNIFLLVTYIPSLALYWRRLHDVGKSGWWLLISFTGFGVFYLFYLFVCDSERETNEYGENPKTLSSPNEQTNHNNSTNPEKSNEDRNEKKTNKKEKSKMIFTRDGWIRKE